MRDTCECGGSLVGPHECSGPTTATEIMMRAEESRPFTAEEREREVAYARGLLDGPDGYMIEPIRRHEYARAILAWDAAVREAAA